MTAAAPGKVVGWLRRVGPRYLPFADAATAELPLSRIFRLGLFQVTVGMAMTLLLGTLNRVMIVELSVPSSVMGTMLAIPLMVAPFRALFGHRSDHHRSIFGWRRVPFLWAGTLLQFAGLAMMPFALILLSPEATAPKVLGYGATALAYLLTGSGAYLAQTAGLALATDLASESTRPRLVGMLYLLLQVGTILCAGVFGLLLQGFSTLRLVQVIQGAALVTLVLNLSALWKQEQRRPSTRAEIDATRIPPFRETWRAFLRAGQSARLLVGVALGAFAFNIQDVLLEPYGGEILGLSVARTTSLTAIMAAGGLISLAWAAPAVARGFDPIRLSAIGLLIGVFGFLGVIAAAPAALPVLFYGGTMLIGVGEGLFALGTIAYAMELREGQQAGLALGAWGAFFATAEGLALLASGILHDALAHAASRGALGPVLSQPDVPYSFAYHLEIVLLFLCLVVLGPLARPAGWRSREPGRAFGLAELPG